MRENGTRGTPQEKNRRLGRNNQAVEQSEDGLMRA